MFITVLKSKIHRVRVTQAELNYVGSITLDENLMHASGIIENEKVQVVNINNGERFETYVIKGEKRSGIVCLNGPAARLVQGLGVAQPGAGLRGRHAGRSAGCSSWNSRRPTARGVSATKISAAHAYATVPRRPGHTAAVPDSKAPESARHGARQAVRRPAPLLV